MTNRGISQWIAFTLALALVALGVSGCGGRQEQATTPVVTEPTPAPVVHHTTTQPTPVYHEEWVRLNGVRILYPQGGSRLDDQARALLREAHASFVHRTDIVRVRVEGHSDTQGTRDANQRLGLERAQGVVDFLVGDLGLPRELFEVQSMGEDRPLVTEGDATHRVQNRRVEFSLLVRRQSASARAL